MNDVAHITAEYAVELILAPYGVTTIAAFAQTVKFAAIIPASGFLTYVSADGSLVAKLGARHLRGSLSEDTAALPDKRAFRDLGDGREGADANAPFSGLPYTAQCIQLADAHEFIRIEHMIPKAAEKVCSPCMKPGPA
jgi:hypothetical protein